ncbi:MAG: hypothetical protein K0U47_11145 [Epsilonproteobacteria bacterium]|nr:hypothetical protein [Campylobacterota bacterium]
MSLAHKLYNIGEVITKKETIEALIRRIPEINIDYQTVAIDFSIAKNQTVSFNKISNNSCDNAFYSEKLGGSGTAIFYLYPNVIIHNLNKKSNPYDKLSQLVATVENILSNQYANQKNIILLQKILEQLTNNEIVDELRKYTKANYLFLITINHKSLYEVMPEAWENWFQCPTIPYTDLETKTFFDFISSEKTEVGYSPDIGCFTVNNYNDKLKHRIIDNLPLSKMSARYIKFGWLYAKEHLLFYFDGMQFMVVPSYVKQNNKEFQEILSKLKQANENSIRNRNTLKVLANEEEHFQKEVNKLKKAKRKDEEKIKSIADKLEQTAVKKVDLLSKIPHGLFTEFSHEVQDLEFIQGLTVDFIFMELNKNEVKIFGSLEEVLPSRVMKIVQTMQKYNIDDRIAPKNRDFTKTYLQDFFHRDELYFYQMNKRKNDPKDSSYRPKILGERFFLAKLLLGDEVITKEELYRRFEFNAEYTYNHKRRLNDKMVKNWMEESGMSTDRDEKNILAFFQDKEINKLKDG